MISADMLPTGTPVPKQVNVFTQTPTLSWYRVIPPFSWVTHPKQAKRLRPAGHSAWVEAMHQPVLFLISLAFTAAGLYTLAKEYVAKAFTAIGAGDYGQIVPVCLALFVIVITGGAIEIAFLTAASRLRMHLLRHEWGWTAVSFTMLILTVATEGLTCSYMFYLIEAPKLSPEWLLFMQGIPTLLFFVRAFAGLVCAAYLIIGVLPFVIRPEDVRREMAAEAGAAKVAIIQRLLHVVSELNVMQMLAIYEPIAAIFRDNAGYSSQQMTHRLVLDALGQARIALIAKGATPQQVDAALTQLEEDYRQRGVGVELEKYDEQTHKALTRLQDRLLTSANQAVATTEPQLRELVTQYAVTPAQMESSLTTVKEQMRTWMTDIKTELSSELTTLVQGFEQQMQDFTDQQDSSYEDKSVAQSTSASASTSSSTAVAQPKLGTKKFTALVYQTAQQLDNEGRLSLYNVAQVLHVDPDAVRAALQSIKDERIRKLKPGNELAPDSVLDIL